MPFWGSPPVMLEYMWLVSSLWMIPHNSSNKRTTSMNFCLHVSRSMVSISNIRLVQSRQVQLSRRRKERQLIPQETKLYEWVYIENGWLGYSQISISLNRMLKGPSNFATYYPSIWTIHPCHTTGRGTNYFLKEPPDAILGPCFWYVEIYRD